MADPTFDHERLDVYRLTIEYVAFSYQIAKTLGGVNRHARGSALECTAIHDALRVCDAIDEESNGRGKNVLKRIVSMLTRLVQRTQTVLEGSIEYEYEYRTAEYERDAVD